MDSFNKVTEALTKLLSDDSAIEFTWRRPEVVNLRLLTEAATVAALSGRMSAQDIVNQHGTVVVKSGTVFDPRTISAAVNTNPDHIDLTPLPSVLSINSDVPSTSVLVHGMLQAAGYQTHSVSTGKDPLTTRALIAEHVRTEWTDLVVAIDSAQVRELFPEIQRYEVPMSPALEIGMGTVTIAGWQLPLVVLPQDAFAAWIGMRQIVLSSLATSLGDNYRPSSSLVQIRTAVETDPTLTKIVPARIRRGFAEILDLTNWAQADGYLVLPADSTLEVGTPVEALHA